MKILIITSDKKLEKWFEENCFSDFNPVFYDYREIKTKYFPIRLKAPMYRELEAKDVKLKNKAINEWLKEIEKFDVVISDFHPFRFIEEKLSSKTLWIEIWHGVQVKKQGNMRTFETQIDNGFLLCQNQFQLDYYKSLGISENKLFIAEHPKVSLYKTNTEDKTELKKRANIKDKHINYKLVTYAPTYNKLELKINYDDLIKKELKANKKTIFLVKKHYTSIHNDKTEKYICSRKYKKIVYKCPENFHVSNVFKISDKVVTDYSSIIVDFACYKNSTKYIDRYITKELKDNYKRINEKFGINDDILTPKKYLNLSKIIDKIVYDNVNKAK